jgi:CrcB protein
MKLAFIVGIGSFLGGVTRYLLSLMITGKISHNFPFATFTINIIGCFFIGCLFGLVEKWQLGIEWRLFLVTGILGGFTTFSAFSAETHYLVRTGHIPMAITYVVSSIIVGIGLTFIGAWLFRFIP